MDPFYIQSLNPAASCPLSFILVFLLFPVPVEPAPFTEHCWEEKRKTTRKNGRNPQQLNEKESKANAFFSSLSLHLFLLPFHSYFFFFFQKAICDIRTSLSSDVGGLHLVQSTHVAQISMIWKMQTDKFVGMCFNEQHFSQAFQYLFMLSVMIVEISVKFHSWEQIIWKSAFYWKFFPNFSSNVLLIYHWTLVINTCFLPQCIFRSGWGWKRGGYTCKCRDGYYSSSSVDEDHSKHSFNGSLVESAWRLKNQRKGWGPLIVISPPKCSRLDSDSWWSVA